MWTGARPTLHVLEVCLAEPSAWIDSGQYRAIQKRDFRSAGSLTELGHPIIRAGHSLTRDADSANGFQIHNLTHGNLFPTLWRELKTGQWRGLITQQDKEGQWWLILAGLERENDHTDIYKQIRDLGKDDITALYPTEDDLTLLNLETAHQSQSDWELRCIDSFLQLMSRAFVEREKVRTGLPPHPSHVGARMDVEIEIDVVSDIDNPESSPSEVLLSIELGDWTDSVLLRQLVPLLLNAVDPVLENWDSTIDSGLHMMFALLTTASSLKNVIGPPKTYNGNGVASMTTGDRLSISMAHYLPARAMADAHVHGTPLKALCGQWFVPTKNPDNLKTCPQCDTQLQSLPE